VSERGLRTAVSFRAKGHICRHVGSPAEKRFFFAGRGNLTQQSRADVLRLTFSFLMSRRNVVFAFRELERDHRLPLDSFSGSYISSRSAEFPNDETATLGIPAETTLTLVPFATETAAASAAASPPLSVPRHD